MYNKPTYNSIKLRYNITCCILLKYPPEKLKQANKTVQKAIYFNISFKYLNKQNNLKFSKSEKLSYRKSKNMHFAREIYQAVLTFNNHFPVSETKL